MTIGSVPESTIGALLSGRAAADAAVADFHVNGGRVASTATELLSYYKELGSVTPEAATKAQQAIDAVGWLERADSNLGWSENALLGSLSFQLVPPAAAAPSGEGNL